MLLKVLLTIIVILAVLSMLLGATLTFLVFCVVGENISAIILIAMLVCIALTIVAGTILGIFAIWGLL